MSKMDQEFFDAAGYNLNHSKVNYMNLAGIIPEVIEERHIKTRLPANYMHMNHVGIVYAGSYFVFAEASGATLIKCTYGGEYVTIIKSVEVDYVKPSKSDIIIDISMTEQEAAEKIAYIVEHGKGQYPMDIPIRSADGELCANVHIVFYLFKKQEG